jgi:hypothetical protein
LKQPNKHYQKRADTIAAKRLFVEYHHGNLPTPLRQTPHFFHFPIQSVANEIDLSVVQPKDYAMNPENHSPKPERLIPGVPTWLNWAHL